ncbi:MAG: holo-ACP synthase [Thermoanaerobaculaceae bacterium]|nr:holo-ACP synthase [Thermoanaerobaculaceae bacterium]
MIVGLGIDAVGVARVARLLERHPERLFAHCFSAGEVRRPGDAQHVSGLLAAKEAAFKALGTGWGEGVGWRQVVVERLANGQPSLRLEGVAARRAIELGVGCSHLSITHDGGLAIAVVILEAQVVSPPGATIGVP